MMKPLLIRSAMHLVWGVLLVSTGHAAELDVARTTVMMASPGSSVLVDAVISNPTDQVVFLNGISSDVDVQFAANDLFDEFRAVAPDSLLPGETWEGPVVRLTIVPEAVVEAALPVSVFFTGGDHSFDAQELAILTFGLIDSVGTLDLPQTMDPVAFGGLRVWPNPLRQSAEIAFDLALPGEVDVRVYDVRGRAIRTLVRGFKEAGRQSVGWDGRDQSGDLVHPGVYFLKLQTDAGVRKTKVVRMN